MREGSEAVPKFGDWDLKNPSSATEFSFIFDKVRQARKTGYECYGNNLQLKANEIDSLKIKHQRRHHHNCHKQPSFVKSNPFLRCFFPSYKS
ncbi:Pathogenic type III effector avirulence factor Avr cleavage site-containing protein [Cynara cardunculus var. scolymus]|uniref:Pathogenic type III effector avirulence factor Avr cleavage site-containing protein n=1 Tax=Cynara cardunculus var. scolymus TaxID=59895 RepID=A0A103XRH2_CYNCS|nr:Pathogenic type III effector avirulence factor Avr cleavage site-containing protein [Cynara cardunculus var. scolymus]